LAAESWASAPAAPADLQAECAAEAQLDNDDRPIKPVTRAPAPVRSIGGSYSFTASNGPVRKGFIPSLSSAFVSFAHIADTIEACHRAWNATLDWREFRYPWAELAGKLIEARLSEKNFRAVGSEVRTGRLLWLPDYTWRRPAYVSGNAVSPVLAAMASPRNTVTATSWNGAQIDCYPFLICRDLASVFGAQDLPPPLLKSVIDQIRDIETRPPPKVAATASGAVAVLPRAVFTAAALGFWFKLRVATWPKFEPTPSESTDLAAAEAYFDTVPRDVFRRIRRENTPESWRKPGPRKGHSN